MTPSLFTMLGVQNPNIVNIREVNENFDQEPAFYLLEVSWDEQRA